MSHRLAWIDIAKGIGIILVVVAHVLLTTHAGSTLTQIIYQFHMPLFFIIAGMTLRTEQLEGFIKRKTIALLLPYLLFLSLLGLPALAVSCVLGGDIPQLGIDRCIVMPVKLIFGGSWLGGIFGTFWFVPCLFFGLIGAQLLLATVEKLSGFQRVIALAVLLVLAYGLPAILPTSTRLLSVGSVPMAVVFIGVGFWIGRRDLIANNMGIGLAIVMAFLALATLSPFDMKFGIYGAPGFGVTGAAALSYLLVGSARFIAKFPMFAAPLQSLGQKTLTILYVHQAIHLSLRFAGIGNDILLIAFSLAIPLWLHRPLMLVVSKLTDSLRYNLSPKSPPI